MSAWKNLERKAASDLGGKRNSRGSDFGVSAPDVDHSLFSVECKYRKQLPQVLRLGLEQAAQYDQVKIPVLVLKERGMRGAMVVMKLKDFSALFGALPEPD